MESVLDQGYPNLEYVVVDGGSRDGSAELIASFGSRLSWWISEPDGGQYDAINKGFTHTSGEIMAWLNSDDRYFPGALSIVGDVFATFPEIEWLTTAFPVIWDENSRPVACSYRVGYSRAGFGRGEYLPHGRSYSPGYLQQESTFWRRSLWNRCNARLDTSYRVAADFDLWMRFSKEAELYSVEALIGGYRSHGDQRTYTESTAYAQEAEASLQAHGGRFRSVAESYLARALSHLPRRARRWAIRAGLADRRPVCVFGGPERSWHIEDR
jgi:glycosyltransferase involved in cell wall biosynthesis